MIKKECYLVCKTCGLYTVLNPGEVLKILFDNIDFKKIEICEHIKKRKLEAFKVIGNKENLETYMYEHFDKDGKWQLEVLPEDNRNDNIGRLIMVNRL
jgi:hypothetical protein